MAEDKLKQKQHGKRTPFAVLLIIMVIVAAVIFVFSVALGQYWISPKEIIQVIFGTAFGLEQTWDPSMNVVLFNIRIPRILCALMIGIALACSGATYQGIFKNPMVSPDILGASAGASFGAALAILLGFNTFEIEATAFIMGMIAVGVSVGISNLINKGANMVLLLVLTGMVVQALFSAFVSIIKYVADPESTLPTITYWLMGGLNSVGKGSLLRMFIPLVIGIIPLFVLRWKINVLAFGDEEAKSLGINTGRTRIILVICATLLTTASVSIAGMVGWVGLVIPHLARMIVGPDYRKLLPVTVFVGGSFMMVVDDISRLFTTTEIPLSIITAIVGAPFFLYLLVKGKEGWSVT